MKKLSVIAALLVGAALIFNFTGCDQASDDSAAETYTITIADGIENGKVTASKTSGIEAGEKITLTITPDTDYELNSISVDNDITLSGTNNTRTFKMPERNVTVTASFIFKWIGTKNPSTDKVKGDIVFNDGSAMPYSKFVSLDEELKNIKKTSAIAFIFYKGTSENDELGIKTLGIGLNSKECNWCSNTANAFDKNITNIVCTKNENDTTFTGDKDGSDNFKMIASFLSSDESGTTDDTGNTKIYYAFEFAKNYKNYKIGSEENSRVGGSAFEDGWYVPSIAELYQLYNNRYLTNSLWDTIDSLGVTISTTPYWSSSQDASEAKNAFTFRLKSGQIHSTQKDGNNFIGYRVCVIREFN